MDLTLDFNTDPDGGGLWKTVTTKQAKQMKGKLQAESGKASAVSDQELSGMLLDQGISS